MSNITKPENVASRIPKNNIPLSVKVCSVVYDNIFYYTLNGNRDMYFLSKGCLCGLTRKEYRISSNLAATVAPNM